MSGGVSGAVCTRPLVETAQLACWRAGDLLTERASEVAARPKAGVYDLVTEYDVRAEQTIVELIRERHPRSVIIGEEGGRSGDGSLCWHVDGLDGTGNFVRGLPLFAVSVAVEASGRLVAACVYDPTRRETFTGDGERLSVNGVPATPRPPADAPPCVLTDLPQSGSRSSGQRRLAAALGHDHDLRRIGSSALALAWTAAGRAEAACNLRVRSWDVAAGALLVISGGGRYWGLSEGGALAVRSPWTASAFVACGAGRLHVGLRVRSLMRDLLARSRPDQAAHPGRRQA